MSSNRYPRKPSRIPGEFGPARSRFVRSPAPSRSPEPASGPKSSDTARKRALNGWTPKLLSYYGALDLRGRDCQFGDLNAIHPLLQRRNFICTDLEYASIRRALCLASAFLYEPVASVFWYSLIFGPRKQVPHIVKLANGGMREATESPWSSFSAVPFGPEEMVQLNAFWEQMQHAITYEFIDEGVLPGDPCSAITNIEKWDSTRRNQGPLLGGLRGARTGISERYPAFLGPIRANSAPDDIAYALREDYFLAITILHELAHAINIVRMRSAEVETEPFFEDMREAELGFAWEQLIMNGRQDTVIRQGVDSARMGLYFFTWPGTIRQQEQSYVGKYPLDDEDPVFRRFGRRQWKTTYLVMMEHIQELALQRTWGEIARYGPERLKMQKLVGRRFGAFDAKTRAAAQSSGEDSLSWGSSGFGAYRLVVRDEELRRTRKTRRRSSSGEFGPPNKKRRLASGRPV